MPQPMLHTVDNLISDDAEWHLLASLVRYPHYLDSIRQIVKPEFFARPLNEFCYRTILKLADQNVAPTELTLAPIIGRNNIAIIMRYAQEYSIFAAEQIADGIRDFAQRRQLQEQFANLAQRALDTQNPENEVASILADSIAIIEGFSADTRDNATPEPDVIEQVIDQGLNPPPCSPTGLPTVDRLMLGGLQRGKFYGLGARKKAGKTMFLSTVSAHLSASAAPHVFVSLEMHPTQIQQRKLAQLIGVNAATFVPIPPRHVLDRAADIHASMQTYCWYVHRPAMTLSDLLQTISRSRWQHGVVGVVIDYQQLVRGRGRDQTQAEHQDQVAQQVADLCRKLNLWCMMAAQLNQEGNTRGGEGLRNACDLYWVLHKLGAQGGWLEMQESRYTRSENVGSEEYPGLWLHDGAYWSEEPGDGH